jgi:23S rRNA (guanosine2251-2'-O)-methyltransferase
MTASIVIEGKISVNAVLHSKYRKVLTLFYDVAKLQRKRNTKQAKSLKQILELVNSKEIKIDAVDHDWFEKNANGKTHGGIAATVSERTYQKLPELIKSKPGIIFFLEGIEDPYNLGYTIRSLYAAGIDGIVMKQRSWLDVEAIIIKSSAGTSELMPIALVEDLETTADFFKSNNYSVACTAKDKGQSIYQSSLNPPLFIIIGGEKRGINRTYLDKADLRFFIPYKRDFAGSLPLNSAATIIGFEILRQRYYSYKGDL